MQVQIGLITRLDDGYVLSIHGKNHVARNAKELGALVARLAGKRMVGPTVAQNPIPGQNPPENVVPIRPPEPTWAEQRALDDKNLTRLITARLGNRITGEDVMRGASELIKTYTMEEVAGLVLEAEKQFFQTAEQVKDRGLGTLCGCPGCPQNQSYPNERGWCVGCYQGEHLHPWGDGNGTVIQRSAGNNREDVGEPINADVDGGATGDGDDGETVDSAVPTYESPEPVPGDPEYISPDDHPGSPSAQTRR